MFDFDSKLLAIQEDRVKMIEKRLSQDNSITSIITAITALLGEVDYALSAVYTLMDSAEVYNNWISGDYFLSGMYAG